MPLCTEVLLPPPASFLHAPPWLLCTHCGQVWVTGSGTSSARGGSRLPGLTALPHYVGTFETHRYYLPIPPPPRHSNCIDGWWGRGGVWALVQLPGDRTVGQNVREAWPSLGVSERHFHGGSQLSNKR